MAEVARQRPPRSVVVIGGGISGLAAAYDLAGRGVECTLIEAAGRLGGVIRTDRADGCLVEAGPDSFIAQKPWALELIRELGLGDDVIGSNDHLRKTYVLRGGRLIPLPDGIQFLAPTKIWPVLTTPLLSAGAKLRMLGEWLRRPDPNAGDRSIADFVIDHYGPELNEYLAQPMLAGVYGGAPEQLSVEAVMPRFLELERRYGSVSRGTLAGMRTAAAQKPPGAPKSAGSLFLTLKGGMQQLVDALAARIEPHVRVVYDKAASVTKAAGGGYNVAVGGDSIEADAVILGVPAWSAAELLRGCDPELAEDLGRIPYHSSVTGAFLYPRPPFARPLDGFGFLVPRAEGRLLAACTWVNTKFNHRAPENRAFLRAFVAGEKAERDLSDDALTKAIEGELQSIMGYREQASTVLLQRWDRAMAQYQPGHLALKQRIEERSMQHVGLHISGNAFDGIGVPDCIRRSRAIVRNLF
ncbi:MAG: protoporphyrinogen oxidase [Acidobacteria bacterium]|nr:protoporphyrinogen oxidase [Acidobacteriota bacterium]